jgi:hypothetical protein
MADFKPVFFDPLNTPELTAIICRKFEEQPAHKLAGLPDFEGSGLYAIYYAGTKEPMYLPLKGRLIPLYVGSAQSHNSATGMTSSSGSPLRKRLATHEKSIGQSGLDKREFRVRLLLMPDVHIDLGENGLRVGYKPVWNSVLNGFGSNEQGSATRSGDKSKWDTVHSGRARTFGSQNKDRNVLVAEVNYMVKLQVALCGTGKGIDWATYDPAANVMTGAVRPKKSSRKEAWVDYAVNVHGLVRNHVESMTKNKIIDLYT